MADAAFGATGSGADICGVGARHQQRPGRGCAQEQGQAATAAASTEPAETRAMEHEERHEHARAKELQAEPRVAAAAEPHKRRA
eukprot:7290826-Prymnesium_polylepis.1